MSHCAPEATLKPKRFEFTPKTVITDVFIMQVYWEAVPKTWPGGSKASLSQWYEYSGVLLTAAVDSGMLEYGSSDDRSCRYVDTCVNMLLSYR